MSKLLILSGEIGSGKTTLLLNFLDQLKEYGLQIHGILTPPVIVNGEKTGIDLVDLKTGERKLFATLRGSITAGLITQKWIFDETVMEWGNTILSKAVPCQVLIIDELGPLEFELGKGLMQGLKAIQSKQYVTAIVVIRPALIPAALKSLPDAQVVTFSRESGPGVLVKLVNEISTVHGDSRRQ